jgi:hypothetical protein
MLRLRKSKPVAVAVQLGKEAFIKVRPATQLEVDQASAQASNIVMGLVAGGDGADILSAVLGDEFKVATLKEETRIGAVISRLAEVYLVHACQEGWTGVGTEDGEPIETPDPANIALLLKDLGLRKKIIDVVNSSVHLETDEKNGSAASPRGGADTRAGAPTADKTANAAPSGSQ